MFTEKQQAFIEEYMVDFNGTQAAIRAGYSKRGASVTASQLLAIPKVREAIEQRKAERKALLQDRFLKEAENAFNVLLTIMNDTEEKGQTRYNAAKDILDRSGFKPTDKVEHSGKQEIEFTDVKQQLAERLQKIREVK
jgi:phage terminase small subunit